MQKKQSICLVGIIVIIGIIWGVNSFQKHTGKTLGAFFSYLWSKTADGEFEFYKPSDSFKDYPVIEGTVRNIILLIGDGMGFEEIKYASLKAVGQQGKLYMERLPVKGSLKTESANNSITDSAAGATAIACGVKTNNGMVGMDPKKIKYQSILEDAKANGKMVGFVVTKSVLGATPAPFASHILDRDMTLDIAEQVISNRVNVILGGGQDCFSGKIAEQVRQAGYNMVTTKSQMENANGEHVLGLFAENDMVITNANEPRLSEMARKAIKLLNQGPNGFFVMIEGSQIDNAGHEKDINKSVRELLEFDMAVKEALDFAMKDKNTLVIVTADHETGGLEVRQNNGKIKVRWSASGHSGVDVPVFSFGPEAEKFSGSMENTEIPIKIAELAGLQKLPNPQF